MKHKIHKSDREIVQRIYNHLVSFYNQPYFQTCDMQASYYPLWRFSDKKNIEQSYTIYAFCSVDTEETPIIALESQGAVMLRLYNIILDAFKFLNGNGTMDTFLGIPALNDSNQAAAITRQIWIRISTLESQ